MSKTRRDPDYALKVEHAIVEKYGHETVQHPQRDWDSKKEEKYLELVKMYDTDPESINKILEEEFGFKYEE